MNILDLSEQEIIRRNSLDEMRKLGIEPYPAAEYPVNAYSQEIKNNFVDGAETPRQVAIAGRIMSRRIMGKASFIELKDSEGRIQVYISRDDLCPGEDKELYNTVFKKLLDIGDFIGIRGFVFRTQMGEITVHAQELTVLAKSIRPLPIVKMKDGVAYDAFEDPELRYRQRYVDLVVNEGVKDIFIKRNKVYTSMREYFNSRGYLEVETPILQSIPGGAAARPFITHHNALDIPLYLRIADELYLKRLIVGGFEGVYEFSKNFRNEGMDRTHNPEFTCMEIYVSLCSTPSRNTRVSTSAAWTKHNCAKFAKKSGSRSTKQWAKEKSSTKYSARNAKAITYSPPLSPITPSRCRRLPNVIGTTPN